MMWSALKSVQILILAEGLKIDFFLALSGKDSSLVQKFCESLRLYPFICPHDSEICDSRLSYLKFCVFMCCTNTCKMVIFMVPPQVIISNQDCIYMLGLHLHVGTLGCASASKCPNVHM